MPRYRPLIADGAYFITAVCFKRTPWFARANLARILIDQWLHYEKAYGFSLHAYCVMPNHYHAVLTVGAEKTINQILHAVHSYTSTLVNRALGHQRKSRVWQHAAWDEVIRDEGMFWQKVAYTLLNPWRAGLVSHPLQDYPFSNLQEWKERVGEAFLQDLFAAHRRQAE